MASRNMALILRLRLFRHHLKIQQLTLLLALRAPSEPNRVSIRMLSLARLTERLRPSAGLDPLSFRTEWQKFRDHHVAMGSVMADWSAAWRTWLGNLAVFKGRQSFGGKSDGPLRSSTSHGEVANGHVFVKRDTPQWDAWAAHLRAVGKSPPSSSSWAAGGSPPKCLRQSNFKGSRDGPSGSLVLFTHKIIAIAASWAASCQPQDQTWLALIMRPSLLRIVDEEYGQWAKLQPLNRARVLACAFDLYALVKRNCAFSDFQ